VWPPWGRGRSPGPRVAAVGAWPVPWATCGRRGGVVGSLGHVWPPLGRGRFPVPRVAAVGAWPVPLAACGRRGGVAGPLAQCGRGGGVADPLGFVLPPWGRGRSPGPVWPPWGRGWSPGLRGAAVGAWPVSWAPCGRLESVAYPLGNVWRRGGTLGTVWPS